MKPANPSGVIPFGDIATESLINQLQNIRQIIVTSYQFQCCGTITRWQTYVYPLGPNHRDGVYSIIFQVWRPSTPGADDGCYYMVGQDSYENIVLLEGTGGLVNRTVPQPSQLTVQPGDVVGFFVSALGQNDGSIQFNQNAELGFDEEQAWFNEVFLMTAGDTCPFPIGPGRVLSGSIRAAPVLSLDIGMYLATL